MIIGAGHDDEPEPDHTYDTINSRSWKTVLPVSSSSTSASSLNSHLGTAVISQAISLPLSPCVLGGDKAGRDSNVCLSTRDIFFFPNLVLPLLFSPGVLRKLFILAFFSGYFSKFTGLRKRFVFRIAHIGVV